jgi:hypothetical protein
VLVERRSSTYRKLSVSSVSLGRERDWRMFFWILLLAGREVVLQNVVRNAMQHFFLRGSGG